MIVTFDVPTNRADMAGEAACGALLKRVGRAPWRRRVLLVGFADDLRRLSARAPPSVRTSRSPSCPTGCAPKGSRRTRRRRPSPSSRPKPGAADSAALDAVVGRRVRRHRDRRLDVARRPRPPAGGGVGRSGRGRRRRRRAGEAAGVPAPPDDARPPRPRRPAADGDPVHLLPRRAQLPRRRVDPCRRHRRPQPGRAADRRHRLVRQREGCLPPLAAAPRRKARFSTCTPRLVALGFSWSVAAARRSPRRALRRHLTAPPPPAHARGGEVHTLRLTAWLPDAPERTGSAECAPRRAVAARRRRRRLPAGHHASHGVRCPLVLDATPSEDPDSTAEACSG